MPSEQIFENAPWYLLFQVMQTYRACLFYFFLLFMTILECFEQNR
jgi:hypothetical protein